jgi:hypothetical protein
MDDHANPGGLKVIEGGGTNTKPTPMFDPTTRTSIQKRIQPLIGELKTVVKAAIASEFATSLKLGDSAHERRFARALMVEVARLMFDAGIRLGHIREGAGEAGDSLRQDLIESGVLKIENKPTAFLVSEDEAEEVDEES